MPPRPSKRRRPVEKRRRRRGRKPPISRPTPARNAARPTPARNGAPPLAHVLPTRGAALDAVMRAFGDHLVLFQAAPRTVDTYRKAARHLAPMLAEIRSGTDFLGRLAAADLSPATQAIYLAASRRLVGWLAREGRCPAGLLDDAPRIRLPRPKPKPLQAAELAALEREADSSTTSRRDRLLFWLLRATGIRISEACGVSEGDVDLRPGYESINLRPGKNLDGRIVQLVDGDDVQLPVRRLLRLLRAHVRQLALPDMPGAQGRPLLEGRAGGPLDIGGARKAIQALATRAGVRTHAHRLRHTRATELARAGVSPMVLMRVLGWQKLETARGYTEASELREELTRLGRLPPQTPRRRPR